MPSPGKIRKKTHKYRGKRSMGYGRVGKHRGKGARGGTGKSGYHKGKWSLTIKLAKEGVRVYGRHGFHSVSPTRLRTINLYELDEISKGKEEIDLGALGYQKLLGKGELTHPVRVKVEKASARAVELVKQAGGVVITEAGNA
ncbi:MAG: uL15m family ribosomal protein [Candidatus Marsarchaeota archaeon]|jgi:large subunit ribosomal protein L15